MRTVKVWMHVNEFLLDKKPDIVIRCYTEGQVLDLRYVIEQKKFTCTYEPQGKKERGGMYIPTYTHLQDLEVWLCDRLQIEF